MPAVGARGASILKINYDANDPNSWTGTVLKNTVTNANALSPSAGVNTDASYGAPVYTASGAGAANRAYFDFTKYGFLGSSGIDSDTFDSNLSDALSGYTMEGYFFIPANLSCKENTGIGFAQSTSSQNYFLYTPNGTANHLYSDTVTSNDGVVFNESGVTDINSIIPRGQWTFVVKVHDPNTSGGQIRYYIDGVLQAGATQAFAAGDLALRYWPRDENLGNAGLTGREIQGLGYSLVRMYSGVRSDSEIAADYATLVPEPAGIALLGLAAMVAIRRRRGS
jgi:hypothetical protein